MTLDWRTDDAASDALAQSPKGPPYDQKWLNELNILGKMLSKTRTMKPERKSSSPKEGTGA